MKFEKGDRVVYLGGNSFIAGKNAVHGTVTNPAPDHVTPAVEVLWDNCDKPSIHPRGEVRLIR